MKRTGLLIVLFLFSKIAYAHHPLDGMPMETFLHGLLSGVAHPVLGFAHLFFIIAVGITAALTRFPLSSPLFVIGGIILGVALSVLGWHWSFDEYAIALSLFLLGGIGMLGKSLPLPAVLALFSGLGVFHGLVFGEVLSAQPMQLPTVLTGYLAGLTVIHWSIAVAAGVAVARISKPLLPSSIKPRLAGLVVTAAGAVYLMGL